MFSSIAAASQNSIAAENDVPQNLRINKGTYVYDYAHMYICIFGIILGSIYVCTIFLG